MTDDEKEFRGKELKNALLFFALAAVTFVGMYFLTRESIFAGGTAAASVLAIGISRGIALRSRRPSNAEDL